MPSNWDASTVQGPLAEAPNPLNLSRSHHVLMLWSACLLTVGAYFSKDVLAAVSPQIIETFNISRQEYGTLYGLPGIPNIFASLIGGAIVDRISADRAALLFSLLVVLGSLFTAAAPPIKSKALLAMGQLCMGLGKGSLITSQKVFLKMASYPDEVSLYFAISFSTSHGGTFLAFLLSPIISSHAPSGYQASLWTSVGLCIASCLCSLPLLGKISHFSAAATSIHDDPLRPRQRWSEWTYIYCKPLLSIGFLLVTISMVFYYLSYFPFTAFAVDFLHTQGLSSEKASVATSLLALASIFLGPLFGKRVDVELGGWKQTSSSSSSSSSSGTLLNRHCITAGTVQLIAMINAVLGFALIIWSPALWILSLILISLSFAMASASMWPTIPVVVPGPSSLGLAFGVIHALMDFTQLLLEMLVGRVLDVGGTYRGTIMPIFISMALVALVSTALTMILLARKRLGDADGTTEEEKLVIAPLLCSSRRTRLPQDEEAEAREEVAAP